jgi:two-component system NtrC family sensor kinase
MSIPGGVKTRPGDDPAAPSAAASVLVIDDEALLCRVLSTMLKADGYEVVTAQSGKEAVERLRRQHFELALTDLVMPEMDGIQTMTALKDLDPDIEVIILTGHTGVESAIAALKQGACDYLLKPINMVQLRPALTRALEMRRLNTTLSLYEASRTLLATLDRQELTPAVLELAQRAMRANAAGLARVPPEGTGLHVDLSKGDGPLTEAAVKSLAQQAMQAREALRDPSFIMAGHSEGSDAGIPAGSVLAYPLEVRNALRGALVLWRDKGVAPFTVFELRSGKILAAEIAVALDNARLYRELSRKVEELETAHGEVARAEAHARAVIETAQEAIVLLDQEGVARDFNPTAARIFGWSREQTVGRNLADFAIPPRLLDVFRKHLDAACRVGRDPIDKCMEVYALRQNGEEFPLEIQTAVIEAPEGKLLSTFARDITERKQAEQALAQERDLLRVLMDNLPDYIYFKDHQSRFLRTNMAHAKAFGSSDPAQVVGKTDFDFFTAEHAQEAYNDEQEVIHTGKPMMAKEEKETWSDGRVTWVSTTKMPFRDAHGAIMGTFGVSHDITQRKRAEEALRTSEERYRELFENASDIVYTTDLEGRLTSLNRVAEQTIGYSREEAPQMHLRQLVNPKHWPRVEQSGERLLAGDSGVKLAVEIAVKDGRRVTLEVNARLIYKDGKPVGVQGIARDITGRDAAEMELRHAQKLESVGRLASGIAHEINTPIQFVGDNTRFLQDSFGGLQTLLSKYQELRDAAASGTVSPDLLAAVRRVKEESDCAYLLEEIPKALTQTLDGVTRVATIVRAMKDFAHPESKEMAAADLNKALLSTLAVARNELKYVADVETDLGDLPLVVCNISDLNQVFLNLLVNAAHAISEVVKGTGGKGKIRVRTVAEGKTVLVTIGDTGCGIPEGIRTKIFDPFFTTKEVGRGTGQGLAIARSVVVERQKGTLTFESEVGMGTTFYIRLPLEPGECCEETKAP